MPPISSLIDTPERRPLWRCLLAVLIVVVCWLAFTPHPPELPMGHLDKLQHIAAFTTLTACAALCGAAGRSATLTAAGGMLAYGIFIELVQMGIPGRSAEWEDVVADAVGIAIGLAVVAALRRRPVHSGT